MIQVSVKDEGIGLSEQEVRDVFNTSFKTRNAESKSLNPYGNGIGLSFCKKICQSLDGDISCSSKLGQGSDFIFTMKAIGCEAFQQGADINSSYPDSPNNNQEEPAVAQLSLFDESNDDLLDEDLEPLQSER